MSDAATPPAGTPPETEAAAPAPAQHGVDWRIPVRWFGLLCLMGAAFFGGYVAWLLWGTGLSTAHAQDEMRAGIERQIDHPKPVSEAPPHGDRQLAGTAYAVIQIPSIGLDMIV